MNQWRFRLRLQMINGKRNLVVDSHYKGMGVCIKLRKKDYEFLKHCGIREIKGIQI